MSPSIKARIDHKRANADVCRAHANYTQHMAGECSTADPEQARLLIKLARAQNACADALDHEAKILETHAP